MVVLASLAASIQRAIILSIGCVFGWLAIAIILFRFITNPFGFFRTKKRDEAPSYALDPRYGEHKIAVIKGHALHYVANGSPDKPLLLLIHGFPENWWSWRHQLTAFSISHYVVAINLPGYGDSEKLDCVTDYRSKNVAEIIRAFIEHLGRNQATVMAHDMGGAVAWHLASAYPSIVKKLVILDCPVNLAFVKHASLPLAIRSWYLFLHQLPYLPELFWSMNDMEAVELFMASKWLGVGNQNLVSKDDMEYNKYYLGKCGLTEPLNYARAVLSHAQLLDGIVNRRRNMDARIKPKTLIIWGGNDIALSPDLAYASAEFCDDARVEVIEGASHWVQQHEPGRVNVLVRQFLDEDK